MENVKRKLVVIVPGSKTKASQIPVLSRLLEKFYVHFGIQVEGYAWLPALQAAFAKIPTETIVFSWSGGISPFAIRKAGKELEQILLKYRDRDICLFTKSLGGAVATKAAQNTQLNIKIIVHVAAPHFRFAKKVPPSIRVINIYSKADTFQQLANWTLYAGFGRTCLPHAKNIEIPDLRHSDFNHDVEIQIEGTEQRLFDFYRTLFA